MPEALVEEITVNEEVDEAIRAVKDKITNVAISSVVTQGGTVLIHQNTVGLMEHVPTTVLIAVILSLATKTMQPFKIG